MRPRAHGARQPPAAFLGSQPLAACARSVGGCPPAGGSDLEVHLVHVAIPELEGWPRPAVVAASASPWLRFQTRSVWTRADFASISAIRLTQSWPPGLFGCAFRPRVARRCASTRSPTAGATGPSVRGRAPTVRDLPTLDEPLQGRPGNAVPSPHEGGACGRSDTLQVGIGKRTWVFVPAWNRRSSW